MKTYFQNTGPGEIVKKGKDFFDDTVGSVLPDGISDAKNMLDEIPGKETITSGIRGILDDLKDAIRDIPFLKDFESKLRFDVISMKLFGLIHGIDPEKGTTVTDANKDDIADVFDIFEDAGIALEDGDYVRYNAEIGKVELSRGGQKYYIDENVDASIFDSGESTLDQETQVAKNEKPPKTDEEVQTEDAAMRTLVENKIVPKSALSVVNELAGSVTKKEAKDYGGSVKSALTNIGITGFDTGKINTDKRFQKLADKNVNSLSGFPAGSILVYDGYTEIVGSAGYGYGKEVRTHLGGPKGVDLFTKDQKVDFAHWKSTTGFKGAYIPLTKSASATPVKTNEKVTERRESTQLGQEFAAWLTKKRSRGDDKTKAGQCGEGVYNLINDFFATKNIKNAITKKSGRHGEKWDEILSNSRNLNPNIQVTKIPIDKPSQAPLGSIINYDAGSTHGTGVPKKGGPGSGRYRYGHVEVVGSDGFYHSTSAKKPGGSTRNKVLETDENFKDKTKFTGIAYQLSIKDPSKHKQS